MFKEVLINTGEKRRLPTFLIDNGGHLQLLNVYM